MWWKLQTGRVEIEPSLNPPSTLPPPRNKDEQYFFFKKVVFIFLLRMFLRHLNCQVYQKMFMKKQTQITSIIKFFYVINYRL